jgi:hypothetical protein
VGGTLFSPSENEELAAWCRKSGIDISCLQMDVGYDGEKPHPDMPDRILQLVGQEMDTFSILPDAFEKISTQTAQELLSRWPRRQQYPHMLPVLDPDSRTDKSTFLICMKSGRIGLLQFMGTADDLSSITLRYQLAKISVQADAPMPPDKAPADY